MERFNDNCFLLKGSILGLTIEQGED